MQYPSRFTAVVLSSMLIFPHIASGKDRNLSSKMSKVHKLEIEVLQRSIQSGKNSKFPRALTIFCNQCKAYNAATDASNAISTQRINAIKALYK